MPLSSSHGETEKVCTVAPYSTRKLEKASKFGTDSHAESLAIADIAMEKSQPLMIYTRIDMNMAIFHSQLQVTNGRLKFRRLEDLNITKTSNFHWETRGKIWRFRWAKH